MTRSRRKGRASASAAPPRASDAERTVVAKRALLFLSTALLAVILLVGCSDGDDAPSAGTATATAAGGSGGTATAPPTEASAGQDGAGEQPAAGDLATQVAMVMAAVDAADSAGFHGIAEDLEAATEVNPRLAGQVANVLVVVRAPAWDESLEHGVGEFIAALETFHEALEEGDLEGARLGAGLVHEAQHHFGPEAYDWLAAQQIGDHDDAAVLITGLAAVDIVDSVGFHLIAEDLADATEINSRLSGQVNKAHIAVQAAVWPEELQGAVEEFVGAVDELHAALEAGDLNGARAAADSVHEAQHDFSAGWYDWLALHHASIDHSESMVAQAAAITVIDVINSFGLHGIAGELETATETSPRLTRDVANLIAVMHGDHFGPNVELGEHLREQLQLLQQALEAGDFEAAYTAAVAAHELQHDLSNGMYSWLATSGTMAAHGHSEAEVADYLEEAPKDQVVEVVMDNFLFSPATIEISAGEVVEFQVSNVVDIPHDFTIDQIDADVHASSLAGTGEHVHAEGMEEADLHFALTERGEGLVHVKVHEPGEYVFWCTVPGHRELGMEGTLIVR